MSRNLIGLVKDVDGRTVEEYPFWQIVCWMVFWRTSGLSAGKLAAMLMAGEDKARTSKNFIAEMASGPFLVHVFHLETAVAGKQVTKFVQARKS